MTYNLDIELTTQVDGDPACKNRFDFFYLVDLVDQKEEQYIFYDPELKVNLAGETRQVSTLEIEVGAVKMMLSGSRQKAADLLRRSMYRYDWLMIRVDDKGKVLSVGDEDEVRGAWHGIKKLLQKDYRGISVDKYLHDIDDSMLRQDFLRVPMSQYYYYGLLFPLIPQKHRSEWNRTREVGLCEHEEELFSETVFYKESRQGLRIYGVKGETMPETACSINAYSGYITVPENDIHPLEANIMIDYVRDNIAIKWNFHLNRY